VVKSLHRFLHPHCPDCRAEREEEKVCKSCESLRELVDVLRYENRKLMEIVTGRFESKTEEGKSEETEPIPSKMIPWSVRKAQLEAQEREKAQARKTTEILEKELGVRDAGQ